MMPRAQWKMRKFQPRASLPYFLNDGLSIFRRVKYSFKLQRIVIIRSIEGLGTSAYCKVLTLKHLKAQGYKYTWFATVSSYETVELEASTAGARAQVNRGNDHSELCFRMHRSKFLQMIPFRCTLFPTGTKFRS